MLGCVRNFGRAQLQISSRPCQVFLKARRVPSGHMKKTCAGVSSIPGGKLGWGSALMGLGVFRGSFKTFCLARRNQPPVGRLGGVVISGQGYRTNFPNCCRFLSYFQGSRTAALQLLRLPQRPPHAVHPADLIFGPRCPRTAVTEPLPTAIAKMGPGAEKVKTCRGHPTTPGRGAPSPR